VKTHVNSSIAIPFIPEILLILSSILFAPHSLYAKYFVSTWSLNAENRQEQPLHSEKDKGALKTSAFWIQAGLGKSTLSIRERSLTPIFAAEVSMHLRKNRTVYAAGVNSAGTECHNVVSIWGAYGYSTHNKWADLSFMAGLGFSERSYNTESESGTIRPDPEPAIILKGQHVVHMPHGFGLGLGCTFHQSQNIRFLSIIVYAALGSWDW
jgi:hypothetical protein